MLRSDSFQFWTKVFTLTAVLLLGPFSMAAQPLFEGYYKYSDGSGAHIGYSIIRNEYDSNKKEHIVRSYLRIQAGDVQIQESRILKADNKLAPLALEYRLISPQGTRTIDAKFSKGMMVGQVMAGGSEQTLEKPIPQGAIFTGSLLSWLMGIGAEESKDPRGLAVGRTYHIQGIDEETGDVHKGTVTIPEESVLDGASVYKVHFEYLGDTHVSYIDKKGEVARIEVPASGVKATLVANPSEATGNFAVPTSIINQVFGSRPLGQLNHKSGRVKQGP